jgi:hypothetical protein
MRTLIQERLFENLQTLVLRSRFSYCRAHSKRMSQRVQHHAIMLPTSAKPTRQTKAQSSEQQKADENPGTSTTSTMISTNCSNAKSELLQRLQNLMNKAKTEKGNQSLIAKQSRYFSYLLLFISLVLREISSLFPRVVVQRAASLK